MRILILGGSGMLGHKLVQVLEKDFEVFSTIRAPFETVAGFGIFDRQRTLDNIDVTDFDALEGTIAELRPDVVINAVGIIKQLASAEGSANVSLINSTLPQKLAAMSEKHGFRLICIGTDCVFSGRKGNYTESDQPDPIDDYGRSKLLGEVSGPNCLTIRTSIIGRELGTANSLVEWFLSNRGGSIKGYKRAIYTGMPTIEFAELIVKLITDFPDLNGIYHAASEPITKFDLLGLLNRQYAANVRIEPSNEFNIDRSLNGEKLRRATGIRLPDWPTMVRKMVSDSESNKNRNECS